MRDSTPGPWDHDLKQRQTFNPLSHPGAPDVIFLVIFYLFIYLKERGVGGGAEGEGQADSALSWEPNMVLDPMTLRS